MAGLRSGPVDIIHDGTQRGVQVARTPRGARALLGLPAAALADGVWTLEEVIGRRAHELTDRLASARGQAGQARVVQQVGVGLDLNLPVGTSLARAGCDLTKNAASSTAALLSTVGWALQLLAWVFAALHRGVYQRRTQDLTIAAAILVWINAASARLDTVSARPARRGPRCLRTDLESRESDTGYSSRSVIGTEHWQSARTRRYLDAIV